MLVWKAWAIRWWKLGQAERPSSNVFERSNVFGVILFSDADVRFCIEHPRANVFPGTAAGKFVACQSKMHGNVYASVKSVGY